jgi:hypothetical protein
MKLKRYEMLPTGPAGPGSTAPGGLGSRGAGPVGDPAALGPSGDPAPATLGSQPANPWLRVQLREASAHPQTCLIPGAVRAKAAEQGGHGRTRVAA